MDTPPEENISSSQADEIIEKAARVLGSIESPDFTRIRFDARRYARLIVALSEGFWIRDISEANTDICSVLVVRPSKGELQKEYVIFVSNVGDYSFIMPVGDADAADDCNLKTLFALVGSAGLEVLSRDVLSAPVKAMTFYSDRPRLFNIIFSDLDYLPWESIAHMN